MSKEYEVEARLIEDEWGKFPCPLNRLSRNFAKKFPTPTVHFEIEIHGQINGGHWYHQKFHNIDSLDEAIAFIPTILAGWEVAANLP